MPKNVAADTPETFRSKTTMRLDEGVYGAVDKEARRIGWSRAQLVEQVLLDYVNKKGHAVETVIPLLRA